MKQKTALIIGAGPGGLTAAWELLEKTDIKPIILEADDVIGGISRTVNYKGNRMDIGGHRFFSKSDRVMDWWQAMMPIASDNNDQDLTLTYHNRTTTIAAPSDRTADDEADEHCVMLVRNRLSRIFYLNRFFTYPISLSWATVRNLGAVRIVRIITSYLYAIARPIRPESSLEDFLINRFGRELYQTFFKDYSAKVWGVGCSEISAEWGAQRIKGLSISKTLKHGLNHALKQILHYVRPHRKSSNLHQQKTETSLIEKFLYPKFGPGQMWELTAKRIRARGGEIHLGHRVTGLNIKDDRISAVTYRDPDGQSVTLAADYVFSTMPVKELIAAFSDHPVPAAVREVADGLIYRDFITVGVLLRELHVRQGGSSEVAKMIPDTWIYIQERDVRLGRVQIFNNWSPWMVADPNTVWVGMEYFCNEGDDLWSMSNEDFIAFAIKELEQINFIRRDDVLDATMVRMPKTYPAYFGSYDRFDVIRRFTDTIDNLFLIGRNGMHKYNNADHSMLTAMTAVDNIVAGRTDKDNIWRINTEDDYHEEK